LDDLHPDSYKSFYAVADDIDDFETTLASVSKKPLIYIAIV